jgi:hypothetical protein
MTENDSSQTAGDDVPTPAGRLLGAIDALEAIADAGERATRGHELQERIKAVTARLRAITDGAVREQRDAGVPLQKLSEQLGVSVQRVSQMANSKHNGTARPGPALIYAARIAQPDAPWHGDPHALPDGAFDTGLIDFEPTVRNRFAGHRLELRYGPVPDDGLVAHMQAYTTVNGRRVRLTAALQQLLFAPAAPGPQD